MQHLMNTWEVMGCETSAFLQQDTYMENAAAEMTVLLQEQKECQGYTLKKEE